MAGRFNMPQIRWIARCIGHDDPGLLAGISALDQYRSLLLHKNCIERTSELMGADERSAHQIVQLFAQVYPDMSIDGVGRLVLD